MTKLYLITYATHPAFNPASFHRYIEDMYKKGWFIDWWHYINNVYIVASDKSAEQLYNATAPGMTAIKYILIVEIDPNNEQGWLPKDAWDWLTKYQKK